MNTMQRVTSAVFLMGVALLVAAAVMSANTYDAYGNPRVLIVAAVAAGLTGAFLVVVFARGDVIARLQRGAIVLAVGASALTMAVAPLNRQVRPAWRSQKQAASGGGLTEARKAELRELARQQAGYVKPPREAQAPYVTVLVPNWPARSALAGSELLAGLAVVVALGLFRRKQRCASKTRDAE